MRPSLTSTLRSVSPPQLFSMEQRLADNWKFVFLLLSLFSTGNTGFPFGLHLKHIFSLNKKQMSFIFIGQLLSPSASSENDLGMDFRGTWRHGRGPLSLVVNISTGCNDLVISANGSSLSVNGQITAHCKRVEVMDLTEVFGFDSAEESNVALYWEPLLDQLKLQVNQRNWGRNLFSCTWSCYIYFQAITTSHVMFHSPSGWLKWIQRRLMWAVWICLSFFVIQIRGKTLTLCWPASVQGSCCTDMSHGPNTPEAPHGIINASVQNDLITWKILSAYIFRGTTINCSKGNGCYVLWYKYRLCQRPQGLGLVPLQKVGTSEKWSTLTMHVVADQHHWFL